MFTSLLGKIGDSLVIVFRTVKSTITRSVMQAYTRIQQKFRVSQNASNSVNNALKNFSSFTEKPSEKADFYETKNFYISKNFLMRTLLGVLLVAAFCYLVAYPLAMRYLFTAELCIAEKKLDSYTGDVIVYYDEEKTIRCYEGHLENGKLEGEGRWYDIDGILEYEGGFSEHVRSGEGKQYKAGELIYEGEFANDQYEGKGKEYSEGRLIRSGTYVGGVLDGANCCTYYKNGKAAYNGQFTEGKQTGSGTSYWESGKPQYTGEFADGVRSGQGKLFDTSGKTVYEGEFQENLYEGAGTLYLSDGYRMTGEFFSGVQGGDVTVSQNGVTYYEGGATDSVLSGEGTLYTKEGSSVYSGKMSRGTVDGGALLGLSLEEAEGIFEEEKVFRIERRGVMLTILQQEDLGISIVFTNYGKDEEDWKAFDVCLKKTEEMSPELSRILWSFAEDTDGWKKSMWSGEPLLSGLTEPQYGAALLLEEAKPCVVYEENDANCSIWTENGECFMLQWTDTDFNGMYE